MIQRKRQRSAFGYRSNREENPAQDYVAEEEIQILSQNYSSSSFQKRNMVKTEPVPFVALTWCLSEKSRKWATMVVMVMLNCLKLFGREISMQLLHSMIYCTVW